MNFRTSVDLPVDFPGVTHAEHLLALGSCFAENIGGRLADAKFSIDLNPFGIVYNPLSVAQVLREVIAKRSYGPDDLFFYNDCWHSRMHHGVFSSSSQEEALRQINGRIETAHLNFPKTDWLMITLGTSYVYEERESGWIVSNCHKRPEKAFIRRRLSVDEVVETYREVLGDCFSRSSHLKVLFTVSPIRHLRDGLTANQLSKSVLLLAVDQLKTDFPDRVFYFPSYEIVNDELRDYRFYADDMVHPSSLAVHYLWEQFSTMAFSVETCRVIESIEEIRRALAHKPFHPESETYQRFIHQTDQKIEQLIHKYPNLDFQKEKELCRIRLNR
ncbi:MAG: GSCFA domain-containing protein [Bacteroides sp.]